MFPSHDTKATKERKEILEKKEIRVRKEILEQLVCKVYKVFRALKATKEKKEILVYKGFRVFMECKATKERKEMLEKKEIRVIRVILEQLACKVFRVFKEKREKKERKEILEKKAIKVTRVMSQLDLNLPTNSAYVIFRHFVSTQASITLSRTNTASIEQNVSFRVKTQENCGNRRQNMSTASRSC